MADRPYPSFLIYKDKKGEYRWRYQASNALTIADSGEGYKKKSDCQHGIDLMKECYDSEVWVTQDAKN